MPGEHRGTKTSKKLFTHRSGRTKILVIRATSDTFVDLVPRLACVAVRAKPVHRPKAVVKLNLGSGPTQVVPGWVGIDASIHLLIRWLPQSVLRHALRHAEVGEDAVLALKRGDFVFWDLRNGIPFGDETAEAVFSSHLLEHLGDTEARRLLDDVARVLVPGGVLRLAVPEIHDDDEDSHEKTGRFLHTHRSRWTWPKLQAGLRQAGFENVEWRSFRRGRCPDLSLLDNRPNSLFVEATVSIRSKVGRPDE